MPTIGLGLLEPTTVELTRAALLGVLGYGALAGIVTAAVAAGYRVATVRRIPRGPAVLAGLSVPTGWLALELWRQGTVVAATAPTHHVSGTYVLGVVTAGAVLAGIGHRLGDHLARGTLDLEHLEGAGNATDRLRSARLSVAVTLPESIDDADGYPAVDPGVKRELEGRTFLFPRRLTRVERRTRLRRRLETDFDVGYVAVDLAPDGTVVSLAVGRERSGLGPTLPPGTAAVAIRITRPVDAGAGDPVEVWTDEADPRLVARGRFRSSSVPVATIVIDAADVDAFVSDRQYRLTVGPDAPSGVGALVTAIADADETVIRRTVEVDGPLENEFAGWVPGRILAIDHDGEPLAFPSGNEPLTAGDTLYVVGTPPELRDLANRSRSEQEAVTPRPARSSERLRDAGAR